MFSTYGLPRSLPRNIAEDTMLHHPPRHALELFSAFRHDLNCMSLAGYQLWHNVHTGEFRMCMCRVRDGRTMGSTDRACFPSAPPRCHCSKAATAYRPVPAKTKPGRSQHPFDYLRWPELGDVYLTVLVHAGSKKRTVWTPKKQKMFLDAVDQLGSNATPSQILDVCLYVFY